MTLADGFVGWLGGLSAPYVVEVGTLQSVAGRSTHHRVWAPEDAEFVMVDFQGGADVDVVDDVERLDCFEDGSVDALICCSTLEHVKHPWRAFEAVGRVLRPGGRAYLESHQTFPLHGYPEDYFRFSTDAFRVMAGDVGLGVVGCEYLYAAKIVPPRGVVWNAAAPAWLNVVCVVEAP